MSLFPNYILREFDNSGRLLSGGKLYFYQSGTSTPKDTYTDATLAVAHTNPVILDASGSKDIWLGSGAYRIWITDLNDVQIKPPIDGIQGTVTGTVAESNLDVAYIRNYADVRAMVSVPSMVYVAGRVTDGDGGQGTFQLLPTSSLTDDDGIILRAGSNVYKRIFDAAIDPTWYGVKYSVSLDQSNSLEAALGGSVQFNFPVMITSNVYLLSNIVVASGASIYCNSDGYFNSASSITITFEEGSHFDAIDTSFGTGVQPIFEVSTVSTIKLSWMGESDNTKWTKLIASSTADFIAQADINTTVTVDLTVPNNFSLDFIAGSKITFDDTINLSIARLIYTGFGQIFDYTDSAYIGTVHIGSLVCYIEWFGGVSGGNAADNAIAFKACAFNGKIDLLTSTEYTITSVEAYTTSEPFLINGNASLLTINQDITVDDLVLNNVVIGGSGSITSTSTIINDSDIAFTITASTNIINRSTIVDISLITSAVDSTFSGFTGHINGLIDNCTIIAISTITIDSAVTITDTTLQKTDTEDSNKLPFFDSAFDITLIKCTLNINGLILYSITTTVDVNLLACTSTNNFTTGLSNGYANVALVSCGNVRENTTATSVDGIIQKLYHDTPASRTTGLKVSVPSVRLTAATTNWHGTGIGSMSSDGNALILGTDVTLDNTPWGVNTIRLAGVNSDGGIPTGWAGTVNDVLDLVWRRCGQMIVYVEYPPSVAPDPLTKICVGFVSPKIGGDFTLTMTAHRIFAQTTVMNLPAINNAKIKNYVDIWGGQVDIYTPLLGATWSCSDEWSDVVHSKGTDQAIQGIPRVVIWNAGTGAMPAGTKITIDIGAYAPTTDQYNKYWALKRFTTITGYGQQKGDINAGLLNGFLWDTPYIYRTADSQGLQVAKARPDFGTGIFSPTPVDMPVTVWAGATSLSSSY